MARLDNLPLALAYLSGLIAGGAEYPDAHSRAVTKYAVDGDDLQEAYDAQFDRDPLGAPDGHALSRSGPRQLRRLRDRRRPIPREDVTMTVLQIIELLRQMARTLRNGFTSAIHYAKALNWPAELTAWALRGV